MVGIKGVGGVPEPTPERPTNVRDRKREEVKSAPSQDGVQISSEAQEAAQASRLTQMAKQEPDVRADRVAAARERLEQGSYKESGVVAEVARRISRLLDLE